MLPSYCYGTTVVFRSEITVSFQKKRFSIIDTTKGSCLRVLISRDRFHIKKQVYGLPQNRFAVYRIHDVRML
jgi:hypothetical protein